ncbi:Protein argonaute 2 [Vitis vinifera]|uniref:Protein argonaute 2 n=1 Tax=Vitis vinifera TaxID=29760 RepID=A0A438HBT3_VITVI|nr:Protein argonaute 2 [Vitis vinifera]
MEDRWRGGGGYRGRDGGLHRGRSGGDHPRHRHGGGFRGGRRPGYSRGYEEDAPPPPVHRWRGPPEMGHDRDYYHYGGSSDRYGGNGGGGWRSSGLSPRNSPAWRPLPPSPPRRPLPLPSPPRRPLPPLSPPAPSSSALAPAAPSSSVVAPRRPLPPPSPPRRPLPSMPAFVESRRSPDTVPGSLTPTSSLERMDRVLPIRRPDKGGTNAIQSTMVRVNHFPVKFNSEKIILHYDVDIKPEVLPKHGRTLKLSKSNRCMIKEKLFSDDPSRFPLSRTAFDACESTRASQVEDYLSGKLFSIPREILQGMDVVMKENPARHMISVGRSFYPTLFSLDDDLGHGIVASRGFLHSLKPTAQGLTLCLDYSVLAFRKPIPVIDFLEEHGKIWKDIKYKDIPCLDLGKNNRKNYVPMEFCILTEGQSGDMINNFGIEVNMRMTTVAGRKSVVEGKHIDRWAVLDFSAYEGFNRLNPDHFIPKFIRRCASLGIRMDEPLLYQSSRMNAFSNVACFEGSWLQLSQVFCETNIGIVTQCCLSSPANKANDQYLANLALKMNAKLGGSNVELIDRLPHFENEGYVMFVGADVNHPGAWNSASPSIAAVVATVNWPAVNRYAARVRPQLHRTEKILNFGDMCLELIETYAQVNRAKPDKIVVFRDGKARGKGQDRSFNENVSPGTVVDTTVVHPFEFDFYLCSHYGGIGTSKPTHYHVLYDEHRGRLYHDALELERPASASAASAASFDERCHAVPPVSASVARHDNVSGCISG